MAECFIIRPTACFLKIFISCQTERNKLHLTSYNVTPNQNVDTKPKPKSYMNDFILSMGI